MRYLVIALIIYLAAALQTTVADAFQIGGISPQILSVVAVAIVFLCRGGGSLVFLASIGLIEDALWPGRLGIAMAWYLLLGWVLMEGAERFDLRPLSRRVVATGLFSGLLACGIGTTRAALGEPTIGLSRIVPDAASLGVYMTAIAVPFWLALGWLENAHRHRVARYDF